MREFKFRVWNKEHSKMYDIISLNDQDVAYTPKGWLFDGGFQEGYANYWTTKEDIVLMQYIGRKDANGKEIYESDIMKGTFASGIGMSSTKYKELYFTVSYRERQSKFEMDMPKDYGKYRFMPYLEQCEVVGNIYENPELVNEKQLVNS